MGIRILDCTLRDGGYLNNWKFGRKTIVSILDKLEKANIDIIECGFLTETAQGPDCSLFSQTSEIAGVLPVGKRKSMYVAMIAIGEKELHPAKLAPCDQTGIGGIRLTFHKEEIKRAVDYARLIMEKGYQVFMQPVGTVFYSDLELLQLVEIMNKLRPYAFYIVDTLGSMYRNDVSHRFYLIDKNMDPAIRLGFHGHNNLQLAFSNAQILGKIQTKRTLILDSTVYGMGRGAGNLPTELITQYINKNIESRYDVTMVMDIYDEYIAAIRKQYEWGYTLPYHIAASHVCHPNYASYLIDKQTLTMKDIERIIQSIPQKNRAIYSRSLIEGLYTRFQSKKIDDSASVAEIGRLIQNRRILLLAPGKTLITEYAAVTAYIREEQPYVISINFVDPRYRVDACFVSNHKRMDVIEQDIRHLRQVRLILTSNLPGGERALYVDYDRYISDDPLISDNAGLMLLRLLHSCGAEQVALAGFDGFFPGVPDRYFQQELNTPAGMEDAQEKQNRIREQIRQLSRFLKITFVTPSAYASGDGYV